MILFGQFFGPFAFCFFSVTSQPMPGLVAILPPERPPEQKVTPGESHRVSMGTRRYKLVNKEWILEPYESPPPLLDVILVSGTLPVCFESLTSVALTESMSFRPESAKKVSTNATMKSLEDLFHIASCIRLCKLSLMNPVDILHHPEDISISCMKSFYIAGSASHLTNDIDCE